jgi:hypothetical protein
MRIPKRFKLFGATVEVAFVEQLNMDNSAKGMASFRREAIFIQPSAACWPRSKVSIEQTYCHEIVHHILNALSEDELGANEKFVDTFASALHQVLTTAEYK